MQLVTKICLVYVYSYVTMDESQNIYCAMVTKQMLKDTCLVGKPRKSLFAPILKNAYWNLYVLFSIGENALCIYRIKPCTKKDPCAKERQRHYKCSRDLANFSPGENIGSN